MVDAMKMKQFSRECTKNREYMARGELTGDGGCDNIGKRGNIGEHGNIRDHKVSYYVTSQDMRPFDAKRLELADMIAERKNRYAREHNYRAMVAYDFLEGECRISVDTMKKAINGTLKVNRTFLYKFAVGLQMSVEEANTYFELCGGPLNSYVREDYICLRALEDGDSIELFVKQFEEFTGSKIDMRERRSPSE